MKIALIAGEGILPVEIAKKLYKNKNCILILALRKKSESEIFNSYSEKIIVLKTPSLKYGLHEIKKFGAEKLIMAGRISKKIIYFLPFTLLFDSITRSVLRESLMDDHSLLGSIVKVFENENIKVIPYWQILTEFLAPSGKLSKRAPTIKEMNDINYGEEILKITLPCSFGQAVAVADGAVSAIEAMEGTDAMIIRAGELAGHGVIVKMMRKDQDMRYDLPTVGTITLEKMRKAGLTCLAIESGKTLILEPEKFFNLAEKYKIAVWGI